MNEKVSDEQFLDFVLKAIVENPEEIRMEKSRDERGEVIRVGLARSDMGQVIGRGGATIQAIRLLTKIVGLKNGTKSAVMISEPDEKRKGREQ
ncbi:MAG: KH domain-containing protein [Patescibacteria group bacterium]|nr:KH domain-containing protein [Patescibacteria group bacterium]